MQRKMKPDEGEGRRPRVGVSLDPDVYQWIKELKGESDSNTVNRMLRAAMLAGLTLDEAKAGGVLEEFSEWLSKRKKSKVATELAELIEQFLNDE